MIKILHVLSALNTGGIEAVLLNYYKIMDKEQVSFDFAVHEGRGNLLENEFKKLGCNVFYIPSQREDIRGNRKGLKKILKEKHYDVIHFHHGIMSLGIGLAKRYAKNAKIILHSHGTEAPNRVMKLVTPFLRRYLLRKADYYCACGIAAGEFLYGKKAIEQGKVTIVKNAIDTAKFDYNQAYRQEIRTEFNIGKECFVIGTVGRLSKEKNPFFTVDLIKEIVKKNSDFKFLWVGDGELKEQIEQRLKENGLQDCVVLSGARNDAYKFYSAFDAFVLPSKHEGLAMVAVEAQCSGAPVLLSEYVPLEAKMTDDCFFIPLKVTEWVEKNCELNASIKGTRRGKPEILRNKGYDIKVEVDKLTDFYEKCVL